MVLLFESNYTLVCSVVVIIIGTLIAYLHRVNQYFAKRNIEFIKPQLLFGNAKLIASGKTNFVDLGQIWYRDIKGQYAGIWMFTRPSIVVKDLDLIRSILIRDFEYFSDRGFYVNEVDDPLTANLVALRGERWKFVRNKLSPAFTSGKLKQMIPNIWKISERLQSHVASEITNGHDVFDVRELLRRYTTDIITSVAFGVEIDSINNKDEMFRLIGQRLVKPTTQSIIRSFCSVFFPNVTKKLRIKTADQQVENFLRKVVEETLHSRENEKVVRQDFMQLLVQLRNNVKITDDDKWDAKVIENGLKNLSVNEIIAQVFVFFLGGFETTSNVIAMTLFELAKNPDILQKLQREIDESAQKCNNVWTYESISEMKYLDQIVSETLRLYPPGTALMREVKKTYKVPNSRDTFVVGDTIIILVYSMHVDERYFTNPFKFDPDRFSSENKSNIVPGSYMPFGDGPRNCIGMRLGLLKSKIGIVTMCSKFNVELGPGRTPDFKLKPLSAWDMVGENMLKLSPRL